MVAMPIYVRNHSNDFLPRTTGAASADILKEGYGAPRYIKTLNSFQLDHKQALSGGTKLGKMTQNFRYMNPFG